MYIRKVTYLRGKYRVELVHSWNQGVQGLKRQKRGKPTEEAVRTANERKAIQDLSDRLNMNFDEGDWLTTLTYKPESRPNPEESRKLLQKFFNRLRYFYKKHGKELKFVIVTEWEGKSIHHHLVINDIPGLSTLLLNAWPHGGRHMEPLYANYDYDGLAEYLVKETKKTYSDPKNPYKKRWTCSRNLKRPEVEVKVIKSNTWRSEPRLTKEKVAAGYYIDKNSVHTGVDIMGYPYQRYYVVLPDKKIKTNRLKT